MFRKYLAGIALLAASFSSHAQIREQWGPGYQTEQNEFIAASEEVGYTNSEYYIQTAGNKDEKHPEFHIAKFNDSLRHVLTKDIDLGFLGKKWKFKRIENIIPVEDKVHLLASYNDTKHGESSLYLLDLDKETLEPKTEPRAIASIPFSDYFNERVFHLKASPDSSRFLVFYDSHHNSHRGAEEFNCIVFNRDFELLWEKAIKLDHKEAHFHADDYLIDNKGNVHISGATFDADTKHKKHWFGAERRRKVAIIDPKKPNYHYQLISILKAGEKVITREIRIKDRYIVGMDIVLDEQSNIHGAGLYSEEGINSVAGGFYVLANKDEEEARSVKHWHFSEEFIKSFPEGNKNGELKEIQKVRLKGILMRKDGTIALFGEQYFSANPKKKLYEHYEDLLVVDFNPQGDIEWYVRIPKKQSHTPHSDASFFAATSDRKIYVMFNDHVDNFGEPNPEKNLEVNETARTAVVSITTDGQVSKEELIQDEETLIHPTMCRQLGDGHVVIFGFFENTTNIAKMTLEK